MPLLYIREFGRIIKGKENKQLNIDEIILTDCAWEFLANHAGSTDKNNRFIEIVNLSTLKVKNFVGVITTSDSVQIEILPKVNEFANNESANQSRCILENMLRVINDLPFIQTTTATLKLKSKPLPDVLIRWFLNEIETMSKRGIRSDYLRVQSNEKFLKGQLQVHKQLNNLPYQQHLFHIEYDVLSANRCENRLIHVALQRILKWNKDNENQKIAAHLLILFDDVPISKNIKDDFTHWSSNRDMNYYQPILPWLKLILNQQSPFALKGDHLGISFLFPMEVLFEKYVAKILKKRLPLPFKLIEQSSGKYLSTNPKTFALRPDILIKNGKADLCILDTKWKLIDEHQTYLNGVQDYKKGISQSDAYQLFAYGKKYCVRQVILIYPQWRQFNNSFKFQFDNDLMLHVIPFDLSSEAQPQLEKILT